MKIEQLHTNQRLLILELIKRGASWESIDEFEELVAIHYKGRTEYLLDRFSSKVPFHMVKATADKYLTKNILKKNGLSVPEGNVFTAERVSEALDFAKGIYPVVLKPNWGSHGDNVQVDIRDEKSLMDAINNFKTKTSNVNAFIIEEFKPWHEHRFFITSLGEYAIVKRDPAFVIGDGSSNIKKLVEQENYLRVKLKKEKPTSLCPIVIDDEVHRYMEQNKSSLTYCPKRGEKFYLRRESNLAKGGVAVNLTHTAHPSIIKIAKQALAAFPGMPCVGLDILCKDITNSVGKDDYVIIEVNSSPGLAMHTYPSYGMPENVAEKLANVMFPDFFR